MDRTGLLTTQLAKIPNGRVALRARPALTATSKIGSGERGAGG